MNIRVISISLLVSGLLSAFLVSCDPNDAATPPDIEPGPVVTVNSYPLDNGNQWVYTMTTDVTGGETWHFDHVVSFEVVSDTIINSLPCTKVRSTETEGQNLGSDRLSYRYFSQSNSSLDAVGFTGPMTQVFFKLTEELELPNYSLVSFNTASTDSVIVPDSSLHYMRFPSVDGESWLSNEFGATSGANFKRKWSGFYTVTTDAGTFDCIRLDLFGDQDNDDAPDSSSIYLQQYISPEFGLIKEIDQRDLIFGTLVTGTYYRECTLTSVNVQ